MSTPVRELVDVKHPLYTTIKHIYDSESDPTVTWADRAAGMIARLIETSDSGELVPPLPEYVYDDLMAVSGGMDPEGQPLDTFDRLAASLALQQVIDHGDRFEERALQYEVVVGPDPSGNPYSYTVVPKRA